jgi:hypothetical protein
MNELIKQLMEQANLSEEVAQSVVPVVMSFFKDKLPAPIADQLEGLVEGNVDAGELLGSLGGGNAGGIMEMIMGLLGGKK